MTAALVGLGMTEMGKVFGQSSTALAAEAVRRAVSDAGLHLSDLDGLLVSARDQARRRTRCARSPSLSGLGRRAIRTHSIASR